MDGFVGPVDQLSPMLVNSASALDVQSGDQILPQDSAAKSELMLNSSVVDIAIDDMAIASQARSATDFSEDSQFIKGINLGGDAVAVDGNQWLSQAEGISDGLFISPSETLGNSKAQLPGVDAGTNAMLNSLIEGGKTLSMSQTLDNGTYQVDLWMMEPLRGRTFDVQLEGVTTGQIQSETKGEWQKNSYTTTVEDGTLDIQLDWVRKAPIVAGIEFSSVSGESEAMAEAGKDVDEVAVAGISSASAAETVDDTSMSSSSPSAVLEGTAADDTIVGGDGDDTIIGGNGRDTLTGGEGEDTFVYNGTWYRERTDVITDFEVGVDKVDFSSLMTKQGHQSGDPFGDYIQLQEKGGDTHVGFNPKGDAKAGFFRSMTVLKDVTGVSESDLILTSTDGPDTDGSSGEVDNPPTPNNPGDSDPAPVDNDAPTPAPSDDAGPVDNDAPEPSDDAPAPSDDADPVDNDAPEPSDDAGPVPGDSEPTPDSPPMTEDDASEPLPSEPGKPYDFGIMPKNADVADAKRAYEEWKDLYVSSSGVPNSSNMLRVTKAPDGKGATTSEYHGYGMVFAAHLEKDDTVLEKLWNYTEHYLNKYGLMPWEVSAEGEAQNQSVLDGDVDIGIALDYAARRWPGRGWDARAKEYIDNMNDENKRSHLTTDPIDATLWPKWKKGVYTNYLATAHMERFSERTGDDRWVDVAIPNTYDLLEYSYDNYELPAWFVDEDGKPVTPDDPWNSRQNRHDAGATRTNWRVGTHYLTSGNKDAKKWSDKVTNFFYDSASGNSKATNESGFDPLKLRSGYRFMSDNNYKAGQAYGDPQLASETMMTAAGVAAMAAGNVEMTNEIYDHLANTPIDRGDKNMDNALHVMGLLIMSGGLEAVK